MHTFVHTHTQMQKGWQAAESSNISKMVALETKKNTFLTDVGGKCEKKNKEWETRAR